MNYKPSIHFGSSLDNVSAHALLNFMYNIQVRDYEYSRDKLNISGVNWKKMIDNSVREHMSSEQRGLPVTDFGKSLL